eukprot:7126434-Pyramimonas_sp.AAC.1
MQVGGERPVLGGSDHSQVCPRGQLCGQSRGRGHRAPTFCGKRLGAPATSASEAALVQAAAAGSDDVDARGLV